MLHSVTWYLRMNSLDERATLHSQCRFSEQKTAGRNFQAFITMYHNAWRYNETIYRCLTLGRQNHCAAKNSSRHRTLIHATD
jgi:hypothetical protein